MSSNSVALRTQMILGLCLLLAVLIGYFLTEPMRLGSLTILGLVVALLSFPLILRWHHPLLILSWNAAITPAFLPGSPPLWMLIAFVSFLILLLSWSIRARDTTQSIREISVPLVVLMVVVGVTAAVTGGVGIRTLGGSSYGGKGYMFILASVIGFFVLASRRLKVEQANLYAGMFFLSGITALLPNLTYMSGQAFWWLFYIFPPVYALEQATGDLALNREMVRIFGFGPLSIALLSWLFARYGIRETFNLRHPWRLALLVFALAASLYSGFRAVLVLAGLICVFQFWLEGVHRTRYVWLVGAVLLTALPLLLLQPKSLPMVVQRTISFLPVDVSPVARASAKASTDWRLEMWRSVLPLVPKHLLVGKGYTIDPNELQMSFESVRRGYGASKGAATAGDYHNGPLSVIIPFGLWGVFAFGWFMVASIRYLYGNYRYGDVRLKRINTLLLSLFLARTVFFLLVFGMFYVDLPVFVGLVGLAVCINGRSSMDTSQPSSPDRAHSGPEIRKLEMAAIHPLPHRRP